MLRKRILSISLLLLLFLSASCPRAMAEPAEQAEVVKNDNIYSIFFTHDIHSHVDSTDKTGGLAAIAAKKKSVDRQKGYNDSFLLDGGDFSMGSPFQVLFEDQAAELQLLDLAGYDATTLGNHEFDYGVRALGKMIKTADKALKERHEQARQQAGDFARREDGAQENISQRLAIVTSNIDWKTSLAFKESRKDAAYLKDALKQYGADDYVIIQKGDKKIAVFGIIGSDAVKTMPEVNLRWKDHIERARRIVKEIERNREADLTVCLSHCGGEEDEELAEEVDDIDLIVSGHAHERYDSPKSINDTYIVSAGAFASHLGHIVLHKHEGKVRLKEYKMYRILPISEKDEEVDQAIKSFKNDINNKYFSQFGMAYDGVIAKNPHQFTPAIDIGLEQGEDKYANLIGDAYRFASGTKVDVAIIPKGTIRSTIPRGEVTAADAFAYNSIGTGPDGKPGYPLVKVSLTGRELKAVAEIDASISPKMPDARLYISGLRYKINPNRVFMNRATDIEVYNSKSKAYEKIDNKKLYSVVGSIYTAQMMGAVEEKTYGLMSIVPKTSKGKPVEDFTRQILHRKDNGEELKEWYVLAKFLKKHGSLPQKYGRLQNRKLVEASWNPVKIFKQPNHVGVMFIAALLIPIVIIAALIIFIRQRRQERRGYERRMFGSSISKRNRASRKKVGRKEGQRRSKIRKKERQLRSESKKRERQK